jgi:hypothetical protein
MGHRHQDVIIDQLEPMAPDTPSELTIGGPGGIVERSEVDWFEGEDPDSPCRGFDVEVSVAGKPVDAFA